MSVKLGFRVALAVLLAALAAYGVKTSYVAAMGLDPETELLDDFADMMIEAQDLFGNYASEFIGLGDGLAPGLTLVAGRDGTPYCRGADGPERFDAEAYGLSPGQAEFLYELFSGAEAEPAAEEASAVISVRLLVVNGDYIKFYTHFDDRGCVGIYCDLTGENPERLDTIEMYENWGVFNAMR